MKAIRAAAATPARSAPASGATATTAARDRVQLADVVGLLGHEAVHLFAAHHCRAALDVLEQVGGEQRRDSLLQAAGLVGWPAAPRCVRPAGAIRN